MGESGLFCMKTGQYTCTIDDKGRIMVPSKVRGQLDAGEIVMTKGVERCLLLFSPDEWAAFSEDIMQSTSLGKEQSRVVVRWVIAPAQLVEIDRSGRVVIPPSLRSYAQLTRDAVLLWMVNRMELWDAERFDAYLQTNEENVKEAMEMLPISY